MVSAANQLGPSGQARFIKRTQRLSGLVGILFGAGIAVGVAGLEFLLHADLSVAVSLDFMLVVFAALRLGLSQATAVAVTAALALDFFFIPPVLTFTVASPAGWVSLATFEIVALTVSRLSSAARSNAAQSERQRERTAKLYELSRAILLIDSKRPMDAQLSALIRELIHIDHVAFWIEQDGAEPVLENQLPGQNEAYAVYRAGSDVDDPGNRCSRRILRLGTRPLGAVVLRGWQVDPLLADAVASLAAVALERARSAEKEMRAEAARNVEQLRTAVLDGLAHSFKTPLTAIQTASGGLLAIGRLTETEAELAAIIDEQAALLNRLTTRLLQTAALEAQEVRLRRSMQRISDLVASVLRDQEPSVQARVRVQANPNLSPVAVDAELVSLALLQLIDNAHKYSSIGTEILITISEKNAEIEVAVASTGLPIRREDRERIFHRFYRGVSAVHGPSGTGLGLSIVKKTAEAHGGRAWVESEGPLTRFFFTVMGRQRSAD